MWCPAILAQVVDLICKSISIARQHKHSDPVVFAGSFSAHSMLDVAASEWQSRTRQPGPAILERRAGYHILGVRVTHAGNGDDGVNRTSVAEWVMAFRRVRKRRFCKDGPIDCSRRGWCRAAPPYRRL